MNSVTSKMGTNDSGVGDSTMSASVALQWRTVAAERLMTDQEIAAQWDELNSIGLNLPFMSSYAWRAALSIFGSGKELLLIGSALGSVKAILIVTPDGPLRWRSFQPSQMPLCAMVSGKGLGRSDFAREAMKALPGFSVMLSLTQIDPLHHPRPDAVLCRTFPYIETAWIEIEGTIEDYWAARGKNIRQNIRKQHNRLQAENVSISLVELSEPVEMAAAVAAYGGIESAGWKSNTGTAISPTNEQGRFYTQLMEDAAWAREAVVYQLFFNDRLVATELAVHRAGVLTILKTTYDESIPKNFSPALLLREQQLDRLFKHKHHHRMEFYGKRMEWHTKQTSLYREIHHSTFFRWPILRALDAFRGRLKANESPMKE